MIFSLTPEKENYRNHYIRLLFHEGLYIQRNYSYNKLIQNLGALLNDHGTGVKWFLDELLDPKSRGITGELTDIDIKNNTVFIGPSSIMETGGPEDEPVEIDRNELIRIAQEWQELVNSDTSEIFIMHKDGNYFVTDVLPEGVD